MRFEYNHSYQEARKRALIYSCRYKPARALITLLLVASTAFLSGATGASEYDTDVASKVRGLEHLKFEAQKERNAAALDTLFDDGLMWVDANGILSTKAGYMESLRQSAILQTRMESMTVKVFDRMAIVAGIYVEKGLRNNRPYQQRCRFIDTWSLKRGKWVLIASTSTAPIS